MKMHEYLEMDKEKVLSELESAGTPDRAEKVITDELERILYQYNEDCDTVRGRETASRMVRAASLTSMLVDSVGETRVWERDPEADAMVKQRKFPFTTLYLALFGLLCLGAFAMMMGALNDPGENGRSPLTYVFLAAGVVALYLAGRCRFPKQRAASRKKERQTELRVDANRIWRCLSSLTLAMDQELDKIDAEEKRASRAATVETGRRMMGNKELDLYAELLEAAQSGDGEYALDKLAQLKYFLHGYGVEAVDYDGSNREYFDLMPGAGSGTIRPALVSEGKLLKKGMAAGGR